MKCLIVRSGWLLILMGWQVSAGAQPPATTTPFSPESIFHLDSCRQIVEAFAADSFKGRFSGSREGEKAAEWIAHELMKAGCTTATKTNSYFVPFHFNWGGRKLETRNVLAILPGKEKSDELVVFSAHYDHVGTRSTNFARHYMLERGKPEKGDTIYNGANDNASGISALIMLARYFAITGNNNRTLVFIAFSGEEEGLHGSTALAYQFDHPTVVAMINMDMLGIPISERKKNPYITGPEYSDLREILNKRLYENAPSAFGREFFRQDPFHGQRLFSRSDNYPFARKGVPAHTIIATSPHNRYYHSLNDEPKTLDYNLLAHITKAIALASAGLVDGRDTPSRIDPAKIPDR